ncbi:alpha/beta hydrolase [Mycobacterium sp. TNTM28]|uniref:Alpha/beta hydrolase n=1 Tax=[Mycobacterium] fortunisiensis TaxID=2600579 RepID=A0ABS6KH03_9MYCO|nr:alpha/beta hydrolase [[Mycobacterium] fortunisiensis]MBU9762829.1 alpha/beta hydrolase [[Mycobacterium] fortunisiensis]
MTLDPQIADFIETLDSGFPPVHTMTGAQARAEIRARFVANPQPEAVASVADHRVPVDNGSIDVRVYRPEATGPLPMLVFAHGGGFVFCDLDSHDGLCRNLANLTPAVVVSVDYRLAPEHRWPTAAEDFYAATRWAVEHAADFGADPARVAVGGDSAGGNLAAVTTLMARDRGGPDLAGQLLLYPVIAADFDTDSYRMFGRGFYNPRPALQWYWDQYVPVVTDRRHPYASPLQGDMRGLPPAVVVLTGHDPLRDEGIAYVDALEAAGVNTVRCAFDGGIHGFMTMPMLDIAHRARRQAARALSDLLGS